MDEKKIQVPPRQSVFDKKQLLDVNQLDIKEIQTLLETARNFEPLFHQKIKKLPSLQGRLVVLLFGEPSTRTRISFELAAKSLSADVLDFPVSSSSLAKGESFLDTISTLLALGADCFVIRDSASGLPYLCARHFQVPIINAGDGKHAHPTQALLDLLTIENHFQKIAGLRIGIMGDVSHSRVARSHMHLHRILGNELHLIGPPGWLPEALPGIQFHYHAEKIIRDLDVLILLRVQKERMGEHESDHPDIGKYRLTRELLGTLKKEMIIMHPGPVNRGVELEDAVFDDPRCVIHEQVHSGLLIRMSVLFHLLTGKSS